jgi:Family of unknown function (DUF5677)
MFGAVLANKKALLALSALKLIDCLPDRRHWDRHLPERDPEEGWGVLAEAVFRTADHQSQEATDVRWLKFMHFVVCQERIFFPKALEERIEEMMLYPNKGDMRSVRPMIRSAEMMTRALEYGEQPTPRDTEGSVELPARHDEAFWKEMRGKSKCIAPLEDTAPEMGPGNLRSEILSIYSQLDDHFHATTVSTAPDPRHDSGFGLSLYALTLLLDASIGYSHSLVEGRIMLRSIIEAFLTLRYLSAKDDPAIWLQYRRYGSGQTKLALLKNLREDKVPAFIDLGLLDRLANEDMWLEFQDIKLGHWADLDLRKMSQEGGVKEVYDKYYDWASGYAHGQWVCVRDTVFTTCLNPLHRFHRIPAPPNYNMPSILSDACGLVNQMLEDLNQLYPIFKPRLKWHRRGKKGQLQRSIDP